MSTAFKGVRGGTPTGDPLCRTCRFATYVRGKSESQEILVCQQLSRPVDVMTWEAYECSMYNDSRLTSKSDLERVAWILRSDAVTRKIGFVSPAQKEEHDALRRHQYD